MKKTDLSFFKKLYYSLLPKNTLLDKINRKIDCEENTYYIMQIIRLRPNLLKSVFNRAIFYENELLAMAIINEGINFEFNENESFSPILILENAIPFGLELLAKYVILKSNIDLNSLTQQKETLLNLSIRHSCTRVAKYLIDKGADINKENLDYSNATPLKRAIWNRNTYIAKYLIDHGCNINITDPYDNNILFISSIYYNCIDISNHLLNAGVDLNLSTSNIFYNDFSYALYEGNYELVNNIIDVQKYKDIIKKDIKSYIEFACKNNNLEIGYHLFEKLVDEDSISIYFNSEEKLLSNTFSNKKVTSITFKKNGAIQLDIV